MIKFVLSRFVKSIFKTRSRKIIPRVDKKFFSKFFHPDAHATKCFSRDTRKLKIKNIFHKCCKEIFLT